VEYLSQSIVACILAAAMSMIASDSLRRMHIIVSSFTITFLIACDRCLRMNATAVEQAGEALFEPELFKNLILTLHPIQWQSPDV
jgi:hypothetical protein